MRLGLFGSARAKRGGPDVDSGVGFREFVDYNVEAESLGFVSTLLVEHHFTGFDQISATLNLSRSSPCAPARCGSARR